MLAETAQPSQTIYTLQRADCIRRAAVGQACLLHFAPRSRHCCAAGAKCNSGLTAAPVDPVPVCIAARTVEVAPASTGGTGSSVAGNGKGNGKGNGDDGDNKSKRESNAGRKFYGACQGDGDCRRGNACIANVCVPCGAPGQVQLQAGWLQCVRVVGGAGHAVCPV